MEPAKKLGLYFLFNERRKGEGEHFSWWFYSHQPVDYRAADTAFIWWPFFCWSKAQSKLIALVSESPPTSNLKWDEEEEADRVESGEWEAGGDVAGGGGEAVRLPAPLPPLLLPLLGSDVSRRDKQGRKRFVSMTMAFIGPRKMVPQHTVSLEICKYK